MGQGIDIHIGVVDVGANRLQIADGNITGARDHAPDRHPIISIVQDNRDDG